MSLAASRSANAKAASERTTRQSAATVRDTPSSPSSDPFANLDPALHAATLNSVTSRTEDEMSEHERSRLSDFAQHVLGGSSHRDEAANLLAFSAGEDGGLFETGPTAHQPFTELLDAAGQSQRIGGDDEDEGNGLGDVTAGDLSGFGQDDEVDQQELGDPLDEALPEPGRGPPVRNVGRKRRREGEETENGGVLDPIKIKKDSHKEVERRRRENINDGINELARLIPGGSEKMGKGTLLRRAATYLAECAEKANLYETNMAKRGADVDNIQAELDHARQQLSNEATRLLALETNWREAEDRAAASQFELERIRGELEGLREKHEA